MTVDQIKYKLNEFQKAMIDLAEHNKFLKYCLYSIYKFNYESYKQSKSKRRKRAVV